MRIALLLRNPHVRSQGSFDTIDGRAFGLDDSALHNREHRQEQHHSHNPLPVRDLDRDPRVRVREHHGTESVMNATQVAESTALAQARGSFDPAKYKLFLEDGAHTSQSIITAVSAYVEAFLVRQHPTLARSWTSARCKSWMFAEYRPAQTSSLSAHVKLSWFHPENTINSLESLFVATALWAHLETELRGAHENHSSSTPDPHHPQCEEGTPPRVEVDVIPPRSSGYAPATSGDP